MYEVIKVQSGLKNSPFINHDIFGPFVGVFFELNFNFTFQSKKMSMLRVAAWTVNHREFENCLCHAIED